MLSQLLCADIDFSALQSGATQPGSRLISQIFAKRVANGAIAVLFLNADVNRTQNLSVDLGDLGFHSSTVGLSVRDVWQKSSAGTVAHAVGNFTAHAIPSQDSKLMLFTPTTTDSDMGSRFVTGLETGFSVVDVQEPY